MNRVWVSNGTGLLQEPVSLPVARAGITALERMLASHVGEQVIAVEATGSLHRVCAGLERLHPGAIRLFAPSETKAARTQLGSGRFTTDDRDCAALTYLARQGAGRTQVEEQQSGRCELRPDTVTGRSITRRRPSSGFTTSSNALCPGLSAPAGHGLHTGASCRSRPRPGRRCLPA